VGKGASEIQNLFIFAVYWLGLLHSHRSRWKVHGPRIC